MQIAGFQKRLITARTSLVTDKVKHAIQSNLLHADNNMSQVLDFAINA